MVKKKLGEILVEAGLLTTKDINQAILYQREHRVKLGEAIIGLGLCSEEDILKVLSEQLGVEFTVAIKNIDLKVMEQFDLNFINRNMVLPIRKNNGFLEVVTSDPLNFDIEGQLRQMVDLPIKFILASSENLKGVISKYTDEILIAQYLRTLTIQDNEPSIDMESYENSMLIRSVNRVIIEAIESKASDIHIEVHDDLMIRFRIDGVLHTVYRFSKSASPQFVARIKTMCESTMSISETRLPQNGRTKVKYKDKIIDLRVSTLPTNTGEKVVIRLLDQSNLRLDINEVNFTESNLDRYKEAISKAEGFVLITGPTGSGKTSTLYATLNTLNTEDVNIVTAEDPVEYDIRGINQSQINEKAGITFDESIRTFLRQDPDIILIGEIRDAKTAEIAIQASITGHLVFSTLHTYDAVSSVARLVDLGVPPFMISASLSCVVAQRLVRKICPHCREQVTQEAKNSIQKLYPSKTMDLNLLYQKGSGCLECRGTGYKGRIAIHEVLTITPKIRELIERQQYREIYEVALKEGFVPMYEDAWQKTVQGYTDIYEIEQYINSNH